MVLILVDIVAFVSGVVDVAVVGGGDVAVAEDIAFGCCCCCYVDAVNAADAVDAVDAVG